MPKKIYDIKPPKVVHKKRVVKEKAIKQEMPEEPKDIKDLNGTKVALPKEVLLNETVIEEIPAEAKPKKSAGRNKKEKRPIWQPVLVGVLVVVVVICTYLFFKLPKATIVLSPKLDTLSFTETVNADKSATSVDLTNAVVPAQYFEADKTNAQDFPATGNADNVGEAEGMITIYNKYDPPTPFSFKAGTHFMSDSGKLFIALGKVVIPAATKSGGTIVPGTVQVKVQAVNGGPDYNIAPSNFSIPGLKGTAYYYSINAASTVAMSGGYTGKVKKVTDDDIQGAKDVLTKKTTDDATAALKSQISSDYVLLDNAVLTDVTNASTQTKSGTVADTFNYSVSVKASALVFKKSDLDQLAKNYLISQVPSGKTLLDSSFKIAYSASTVDVSGGKAVLSLSFSSEVYQNVDKNSLSLSLLGENASQVKQTVNSALGDQVSDVQVNFWPFWVFSVPTNQKAVNLVLKFQ